MSSPDFQVEVDCGGKISTLFFRYSTAPGGPPILLGVDSQFTEIGCRVLKVEEPKKVTKRRMIEVLEYRKKKRELFYEEDEEDSTEYTYDD
jgi:hypothetical protein